MKSLSKLFIIILLFCLNNISSSEPLSPEWKKAYDKNFKEILLARVKIIQEINELRKQLESTQKNQNNDNILKKIERLEKQLQEIGISK